MVVRCLFEKNPDTASKVIYAALRIKIHINDGTKGLSVRKFQARIHTLTLCHAIQELAALTFGLGDVTTSGQIQHLDEPVQGILDLANGDPTPLTEEMIQEISRLACVVASRIFAL